MAESHWNEERLGCLFLGELSKIEIRELVRHQIHGCACCQADIAPWLALAGETEPMESGLAEPRGYDAAIDRALERAKRQEQRREERVTGTNSLIDELGIRDLHGVPLAEHLLRVSFDARYSDPEEMWRLALLARLVADNLDSSYLGVPAVADVQARAWAELGNAHRVLDQFEEAHEALAQAEVRLHRGTKDRALVARILDLRASLCFSMRELPEALAILGVVFGIYRDLGDLHLAGRALASKGICLQHLGALHEAKAVLHESLELLDGEREPFLMDSIRQGLLSTYAECGEFRQAAQLMLESGLAKKLEGQPLSLARLRWLEGRILVGLGKRTRAERCFSAARATFIDQNLAYTAGLVALDLAAVWLDLGRTNEATELAQEILRTFRDLGVEPEAVRALEFLERACAKAIATSLVVRHVSRFLQRLEHQPDLRFQRP